MDDFIAMDDHINDEGNHQLINLLIFSFFKPVAVKTTENARTTKKNDCSSKEFKTFERKVSSDICKKNKSFKTAKKEVA